MSLSSTLAQPGILAPLPPLSRYPGFRLAPDADPRRALRALQAAGPGPEAVLGLGPALVSRLEASVPGLREPAALSGAGISLPVTPLALWCWVRGTDRGELLHRGRALSGQLAPDLVLDSIVDGFLYAGGRDLTGYVSALGM